MTLLVLGVSHRSAPLRVLDGLGLTQEEAEGLAADLGGDEAIGEALVLATCNRVEAYLDVAKFHPGVAAVGEALARWTGTDRAVLAQHSYVHFDSAAVSHLFSVASGLDSMVVGESQILGQLRASLRSAQRAGTAGRALNAVVQQALRVGKRVHHETGIDRSGVSVVSVALDAAADALGGLRDRRVLVIGAGSMGALAVSTLAARGVSDIVVASRTPARASRLAATVEHGRATGMDGIGDALAQADVVVSCTGAQEIVLTRGAVSAARPDRRPLVLLDLALPHDIDPAAAGLPGVTRIDLAGIAALPATAASESDVRAAHGIVGEEVATYEAELAGQAVEPILVSLRAHAGHVLDAEMGRLRARLSHLDPTELAEVERAMRRSMATLLHTPTVRMKQLAAEPDGGRYAQAIAALFDLDPSIPASVVGEAPAGSTPVPAPLVMPPGGPR